VGGAFAYISLTSTLSRWFPEVKGFFTGIAVMGVGLGSFVWTSLGKTLLDPTGSFKYEAWQVQGVFALTILCVLALCVPLVRDPPPSYSPPSVLYEKEDSWRGSCIRTFRSKLVKSGKRGTFIDALRTREMALLTLIFFCAEITGLVFLSSAADMVENVFFLSRGESISVTSYLNLANFAGRVGWGWASDYLGRKNFFLFSTGTQAIAGGLMGYWIATGNFAGWLSSFLLIGTLYGGGFGVIPALCSDLFGSHISAATHGVMIGVWACAAIVGIPVFSSVNAQFSVVSTTGVKVPLPEAYIRNSQWLCALPALAFLACFFLKTSIDDETAQPEGIEREPVCTG